MAKPRSKSVTKHFDPPFDLTIDSAAEFIEELHAELAPLIEEEDDRLLVSEVTIQFDVAGASQEEA